MLISTAIITAPRTPCYLGESLSSYFRYWDIIPHVFLEPNTWDRFQHNKNVIKHQNTEKKGGAYNWLTALEWMYHNTDTPYIMVCEDDIQWRAGASDALRTILLNGYVDTQHGRLEIEREVAFISPYCSERNTYELGPRNQWVTARLKARGGWCGALSICIHREVVKYYLSNVQRFIYYTAYKTNTFKILHLDHAIGMMAHDMNRYIITHNPTLVLHVGDISTFECNNDKHIRICSSRLPAL